MKTALAYGLLLIAGMEICSVAVAQSEPRFHPMDQFLVKPNGPLAPLDRSARYYARCAGMYLYAVRADGSNNYARDADASLMAKALSIKGRIDAKTLHRIREDESVQSQQRRLKIGATQRKIYELDEREQLAIPQSQQRELLRPMMEELKISVQCGRLLDELHNEVAKP